MYHQVFHKARLLSLFQEQPPLMKLVDPCLLIAPRWSILVDCPLLQANEDSTTDPPFSARQSTLVLLIRVLPSTLITPSCGFKFLYAPVYLGEILNWLWALLLRCFRSHRKPSADPMCTSTSSLVYLTHGTHHPPNVWLVFSLQNRWPHPHENYRDNCFTLPSEFWIFSNPITKLSTHCHPSPKGHGSSSSNLSPKEIHYLFPKEIPPSLLFGKKWS